MAQNREAYDRAMNDGHEAAWSQDWKTAADAYARALQEFPDDPEAHLNLGFSLLRADRLSESLKVYSRAHTLAPDDPIPLEKSADVLERMGRHKDAAQQYASVADIYVKQRDLDKAIGNWEKATELTPGLVTLHAKLAKAYRRIGDRRRAIYHYLMLAFNLNRNKDTEQAIKAAQQALSMNRKNTEALNILRAIESGADVKPPRPIVEQESKVEGSSTIGIGGGQPGATDGGKSRTEADPLGPMGEAMSAALSRLAEHIMMSGGFDAGGVQALQAMELQRQGLHVEAINAYVKANEELKHPALSMSLGALLLLSEQAKDAISPLKDAQRDDDLRVGAMHALGQAHYQLQQYKQSVTHLMRATESIDIEQTDSVEDRQEIQDVYTSLMSAVSPRREEDNLLAAACRRFVNLLKSRDWHSRIEDMRYQMAEANRDGGGQAILEYLSEDTEDVTESVAKIDRYKARRLFTLAMDEAQYAIEKAPNYLPIHVRMAEIMMLEGRVRQAINKYNAVAKTYRVRGENSRAASILTEVLDMAPLDVEVRINLIELLEEEKRIDDALEQYIDLANTYRQLGDLERGRSTYASAERIAEELGADQRRILTIKRAIADIDQLKGDLRRALRALEDIIRLDPDDDAARKTLIDINFQVGNQIEAIKQLDALLRMYAQKKQVKTMLRVLQDFVSSYPENAGVRSRLAAIYQQLGRIEDAVEHLDKLANLQLDDGSNQEACQTIRRIIKLNPPNVEEYQNALSQLDC